MQVFFRDVRYALRQLGKTPVFTIAALITLALGLGVTVAMFSVIDQVLLRPLPFNNAKRLVRFGGLSEANANELDSMSLPDLKDMAARSHSLAGIGYWTFQVPTLKDSQGEAKIVPEVTASANLFDL